MGALSSFQNVFKIAELKSRLLFTLALLAVYRVGAHIPTPGIDGTALSEFLTDRVGGLMGFFDMFSGGALSRVTIFALGIMPYISASIILQLLTVVIPALGKLAVPEQLVEHATHVVRGDRRHLPASLDSVARDG